jgi:hypothetical protein
LIDYIIVIPASSPLHEDANQIGSLLSNVELETVSTLVESEISEQAGSGRYSLNVVDMGKPQVKLPTTSTSTTQPFEEEWAYLWDSTKTNEDPGMAGPQIALLLVLSISGALATCTMVVLRSRKRAGKGCNNCVPSNCKLWDMRGLGWDEPALDSLEENELEEDSFDELDIDVDCFAEPFSDCNLHMGMPVQGKNPAEDEHEAPMHVSVDMGPEPESESAAQQPRSSLGSKPNLCSSSEGEWLGVIAL